jgi:hypothetical protein
MNNNVSLMVNCYVQYWSKKKGIAKLSLELTKSCYRIYIYIYENLYVYVFVVIVHEACIKSISLVLDGRPKMLQWENLKDLIFQVLGESHLTI